ncbi:hypothetical protein ACHAXA_009991 [Cyclostephanos tholiformis]|uniref:RING-type domain-containing protein n=1 Tax=Cyclostephanos tholiformis TaxID=382380 RepID=A0ABD3RCN7_9STRA
MSSPSSPMRRSTRGAALVATTRIAEALAPQRRSTRLAFLSDNFTGNGGVATRGGTMALDAATAGGGGADSSLLAVGGGGVNRPPRGGGGTKDKPIVLDDDGSMDELEPKPAAAAAAGVAAAIAHVAAVAAAAEEPPGDFTCAICLDAPPCMSEVASISGCTHRFCFDCIDRWAETENRCPCCKARFRTIDRVVALPPGPAETEEGGGGGGGARGKENVATRVRIPEARGAAGAPPPIVESTRASWRNATSNRSRLSWSTPR